MYTHDLVKGCLLVHADTNTNTPTHTHTHTHTHTWLPITPRTIPFSLPPGVSEFDQIAHLSVEETEDTLTEIEGANVDDAVGMTLYQTTIQHHLRRICSTQLNTNKHKNTHTMITMWHIRAGNI